MKIRFITPVLLLLAISFSSCVAKKKLTAANQQISELNAKNQDLTNNLASAQSDLRTISAQYRDFKKDCEALATRYRVASTVLNDQAEDLEKVRGKLSDALIDFENRGVEVFYRDGEVHVSMADKLLYKSGSSTLGNDGIEALGKVAEVLNAYPNLRVVVMGNTDDVQFSKGGDNWSLSTERANGVVRILRDKYEVDPTRLTSAGKGKYNPIADNGTEEGKAKNRRTDIILNPDLEKLWESAQHD